MAKIDEVKEILNTLRITMSIVFGMLVVTVGSLIGRYDSKQIDTVFWIGVVFSLMLIGAVVLILKQIASKTKEIGEL